MKNRLFPRMIAQALPFPGGVAACLALLLCVVLVPEVSHAQSGSFVIPSLRSQGNEFAYWDLFARPPGSTQNVNFNYSNPPALLDGHGEDDDGNLTNLNASRAVLVQTGTNSAFLTSSAAIYSFSAPTTFEVRYTASTSTAATVSNVIFQMQTGGTRPDLDNPRLIYQSGTQTLSVVPVYRALDDPQTGDFSERLVSGYQWDLTELNVRDFKITFASPAASMPLWEAQLDVVSGKPFAEELGYLLSSSTRPGTRYGRAGSVDTNLPQNVDGRFFHANQQLHLTGDYESGWEAVGWVYDSQITTGSSLDLTFPAHDTAVTALFAPLTYATWRAAMFNHANSLIGTNDDYTNNAISGPTVDSDHDGSSNLVEYAFGGDPYTVDASRTQPQMLVVQSGGIDYPAIRYRTNGAIPGDGDITYTPRLSTDLTTWTDNCTTPTTTTVSRDLQADGTMLVTERTLQPLSSFTRFAMDIAWSFGGVAQTPVEVPALAISTTSPLAAGLANAAYSVQLSAAGGSLPYAWSITSGSLPTGLSMDASGLITGTPASDGTSTFTVQVKDGAGTVASLSMSLTVAPFAITTASLGDGVAGMAYSLTLAANGGSAPYVWTVTDGALPPGLSLGTEGILAGTPTTAGSYSFTAQIKDSQGFTATKVLGFNILAVTISPGTLGAGVKAVAYNQALSAAGGTAPYTWAVGSGTLPAGLALSTAGILSGKPTATGASSFTITFTDHAGVAFSQAFTLTVFAPYQVPVVSPPVLGITSVGMPFTYALSASNYPKTFTVAGLPHGMGCNAATGLITGRSTIAGVYNVKISAANSAGSSPTLAAVLIVKALPNTLLGSFTSLVSRDPAANNNLGSLLSLTTSNTGAFSLKVVTGVTARTTTGFLAPTAPNISVTLGSQTLVLAIDITTGLVSGTLGSATITGWRNVWSTAVNPASTRAGYYSLGLDLADAGDDGQASIPQGSGYATFTVKTDGTLAIAGKTADGQAITCAGFISPTGQIVLHSPLYTNLGSLTGLLTLAEDAGGSFLENTASGSLTWLKPVSTGHTYAAGFGPLNISAYGRYLAAAATGYEVLGLPEAGTANLVFTDSGLSAAAMDPDVTGFTYTEANKVVMPTANNAAKTTLAINKTTGAITGTFTLVDTAPALTRKVTFQGQIVRPASGSSIATGWFVLPQKPATGQTSATAPILSGKVAIQQQP